MNLSMRDIYVPACKKSIQCLPLFGSAVPAGFPSLADDYIERNIDLNHYLIKNPISTFFVLASGNSMKEAGINNGDILIVDKAANYLNGSIVIAVVNSEFNLKRLKISEGKIFLIPENNSCSPIEVNEEKGVEIWGVVTYSIHAL